MHKKTHSEVVYSLEELQSMFQRMNREEYQIFSMDLEKITIALKNEGLTNSNQILKVVRNKEKRKPILEKHTEISRRLLGFMRKIRSLHPQKHSFSNLPDHIISESLIVKLKAENIKNTWDLLDKSASKDAREKLAKKIGVVIENFNEIVQYSDLMRLMYIGKILAKKYHEVGITGVEKLANTDPEELYEQCNENAVKEKSTPPSKTDILNNISRAKELFKIFPLIE
ncbi:MAG: DUF4332 domain-containing protein [Candidatus Hodarchaeota archaeon]